ncbi:hypothetical protein AVEN_252971-1 [Araneus ventricosus]|uniref:Uncharacterized protein n=1 Tax=Araneus ventricosus TaxID=182803 RepID=A0A4Y2T569_ARAVE|nr:hypothetical protein AVEN_252971-1 [Araneus ventricosus]
MPFQPIQYCWHQARGQGELSTFGVHIPFNQFSCRNGVVTRRHGVMFCQLLESMSISTVSVAVLASIRGHGGIHQILSPMSIPADSVPCWHPIKRTWDDVLSNFGVPCPFNRFSCRTGIRQGDVG